MKSGKVEEMTDKPKGPFFLIKMIEKKGAPVWVDIRIDDWDGRDREYPRITVIYEDGNEVVIDIIRTVLNNTVSIGHPFILAAIHRWEQIIRYHHALARDRRGASVSATRRIQFERYTVAKNHLENIGKALLKGAKARAIDKEIAFSFHTRIYEYALHRAWNLLSEGTVKKIKNDEAKIRLILEKLSAIPDLAESVIAFLRSTKGKRFLHKPGNWQTICNAYISFCLRVDVGTVRAYRSKAKRKIEETQDEALFDYLFPETRRKINRLQPLIPGLTVRLTDSNR